MSGWKSCRNCGLEVCRNIVLGCEKPHTEPCDNWRKIPCRNCSGALSEPREHNGIMYRHCYSCHFEFEEVF